MDNSVKNWYLIYTKPRQEERAITNLQRQGYETYFPKFQNKKRIRGIWSNIVEPLFPSYIFIHLSEITGNWLPIRSTYGVNKIVKFGDKPAFVPKHIIQSIQGKVSERERQIEQPLFQSGQKVHVVDGPMRGLDAIFHCYSGSERVALLIKILGEETRVEMRYHHVIPAM